MCNIFHFYNCVQHLTHLLFIIYLYVCVYIAHNKKINQKIVATYIVFYYSFLYWSKIVNTDLRKLKKQYSCRIHFADSPRKNSPFCWFLSFFFFFFNYHLTIVRQDFLFSSTFHYNISVSFFYFYFFFFLSIIYWNPFFFFWRGGGSLFCFSLLKLWSFVYYFDKIEVLAWNW